MSINSNCNLFFFKDNVILYIEHSVAVLGAWQVVAKKNPNPNQNALYDSSM